ncbi:uncharacterized protein LOC143905479 [Temnothorax americanus]|uniref:uncharacterized protein LOC143905479 n=1 Tax=Temnothorax americanus TaxID=1964332 RepID=UPI00406784B8
MKHFGALCILLILFHFSTQTPKYENCPEHIVNAQPAQCDCCKVTCYSDSELSMLGCPAYQCPLGIEYHEENNNKEYPDCCGHMFCKQ